MCEYHRDTWEFFLPQTNEMREGLPWTDKPYCLNTISLVRVTYFSAPTMDMYKWVSLKISEPCLINSHVVNIEVWALLSSTIFTLVKKSLICLDRVKSKDPFAWGLTSIPIKYPDLQKNFKANLTFSLLIKSWTSWRRTSYLNIIYIHKRIQSYTLNFVQRNEWSHLLREKSRCKKAWVNFSFQALVVCFRPYMTLFSLHTKLLYEPIRLFHVHLLLKGVIQENIIYVNLSEFSFEI